MDVVFSDTTQALGLAEMLETFEQATGLQVCLRPMTDRWSDPGGAWIVRPPHHEHRSAFCTAVKSRAMAACSRCDVTELPAVCSPASGSHVEPFVRTCHAGAGELLLPLWREGALVGVLFAGQFATEDGHGTGLPRLDAERIRYVRTLLRALGSYLGDVLDELDGQRQTWTDGRRGAIEAYVRESLVAGPTLAELAERLSLSRSRASHAVREATGRSFRELVDDRRLAVAQDLLISTGGTIAWVAAQTGFQDVAYFCRYFKRKTGTTPTGYRRRFRRPISA